MIASESRPHRCAVAAHVAMAAVFLILFGALVFTRLGQYALWDDEANTALFAEAVWRTGDTSALLDHNVIAFRNGFELLGYANRFFAPLQYFLCAPFAGLGGRDALVVRFPFAILGFGSAAFAVFWLWKRRATLLTKSLVAVGFVGNVSLLLFSRQCRYYSPVLLLSTLALYFYVERDGRRARLVGLAVSLALLASVHYLAFGAFAAALATDYVVFGRRESAYSWNAIGAVVAVVGVVVAGLISVWNPMLKQYIDYQLTAVDRLILFYRNLRDLNACEFAVGILIIAAPVLHFTTQRRDPVLLRAPVGIIVYCFVAAMASPQPPEWTYFADVRYLIPHHRSHLAGAYPGISS